MGNFGHAALHLTAEEHGWLEQLSRGRCCASAGACKYVLHTFDGRQIEKPLIPLTLAWRHAGMQGKITFIKIRSSVSTQVMHEMCVQFWVIFFEEYTLKNLYFNRPADTSMRRSKERLPLLCVTMCRRLKNSMWLYQTKWPASVRES